jgi:serine/threonine-protein kinase
MGRPHDPARDLLFGLLALQVGLINQGQLVAAFQAWTLDKGTPLADHLVALGHLDPDDRSAVEALVARHLKKHGGDVEKSLAAVPTGRSTRERLAALADPDIEATLSHVGSGLTPTDDADRTRTYQVGTATSEGQRFRILRPHAKGGLGEVYVAHDAELDREVALKEIQARYAHDPDNQSRFLREAEITGGLEHPGVVPVYGLGHHPDGRPFYAMRFIRGDSLKEAIGRFHRDEGPARDPGERRLALRKLLRRFVDVCNAVAYAHSRGVLHRDLKPGNVMLGPYGETLVVDWGLAKSVGRADRSDGVTEGTLRPAHASGSAPTQMGAALGTPAFMSPEQAAGDLDRLGPRSDVYSLGATLYCLLTGQAPFEGRDVGSLLGEVQRGEFPPPRQVRLSVPPALDGICRKAMALQTADRYDSPRALADEIEHWLADEPVAAYREPLPARLGRWGRRHRPLVAGLAALLVAAVLGLTIGTVLLNQANARTRRALGHAEASYQIARAAVDRNYELVRDATELQNVPGLRPLREALLETARDFYQKFVEERRDDPGVRAELGRSYLRLAGISQDLGSPARAAELAETAAGVFEGLARAQPEIAAYRADLARSRADLGLYENAAGRTEPAESSLLRAIELGEALAREHPEVTDYRADVAQALSRLGSLYSATGRSDRAEAPLRRAADLGEALVRDAPEAASRRSRSDLAKNHHNLGRLYSNTGQADRAEAALRRGVDLGEALVAEAPAVVEYRADLADISTTLGNFATATGRTALAESTLLRAVELGEALVRDHPEVVRYRADLAMNSGNLGRLYRKTTRNSLAEPALRRAVDLVEALARDHPESPRFQSSLGLQLNSLAVLYSQTARNDLAESTWTRAADIFKSFIREHPERTDSRSLLANIHLNLGQLYGEAGRTERAEAAFEEALKILETLTREEPRILRYRVELAGAHFELGQLHLKAGRVEQAETALTQAVSMLERLTREAPERIDLAVLLGSTYIARADLAHLQDDPQAARRWCERAIQALQAILDKEPRHAEARQNLRTARERLAHYLLDHGFPADPFVP